MRVFLLFPAPFSRPPFPVPLFPAGKAADAPVSPPGFTARRLVCLQRLWQEVQSQNRRSDGDYCVRATDTQKQFKSRFDRAMACHYRPAALSKTKFFPSAAKFERLLKQETFMAEARRRARNLLAFFCVFALLRSIFPLSIAQFNPGPANARYCAA